MSEQIERMKVASESLIEPSLLVHTKEIVEYILRGNGRRIVPKAIYLAAWELQYALMHASNNNDLVSGVKQHATKRLCPEADERDVRLNHDIR
jgi:hypothetical protein